MKDPFKSWIVVFVCVVLPAGSVLADVSGSWNVNANGNWSTGGNWTGGNPAEGVTGVATFNYTITSNITVTLDSSPWTINRFVFTNTGSYGWTITNGTFNFGGTSPRIDVGANSTAIVASAIASTASLSKTGSGRVNLNGSTTLEGGLTVAYSANPSGTVNYGTVAAGSGGTLSIGTGSSSHIYIGVGTGTANNGGQLIGTLDVTASSAFTANAGNFKVGGSVGGVGYLYLGVSNTITASTEFSIERGTWGFPNGYGTATTADGGTTTIYTPEMYVGHNTPNGTTGGSGTFTLGSGATLSLSGISGGRTALYIGVLASGNGGTSPNPNFLDLSGGGTGVGDLKLSSLVVGQAPSGGNAVTGRLIFSSNNANRLDISGSGNVVLIGDNGGGGNSCEGTLTFGGGTGTVVSTDNSAAITLGNKRSSGTPTGTLNLNSGTITITTTGSAIVGGGGTSRLNLKDCTLIAGASSTNWITGLSTATLTNNVTFDSDTNNIVVAQGFSGPGSLVKTGAGEMRLGGTSTYSGSTTVSNGTLLVDGSTVSSVTAKPGAGFGGTGTVNGNVTLESGANGVFTPNAPINITGSLVLDGDNTVQLILTEELEFGRYPLATYNTVGSSGAFRSVAVAYSGVMKGRPLILMKDGAIELRLVMSGMVIIVM